MPTLTAEPAARRLARDPLLYVVGLMELTYVWRVQDMLAPLAMIKFPTLLGIAAIVLYLLDKARVRRLRLVRSGVLKLLLAFAFVIAAGVPTSLLASGTLEFLIKEFLPNILLVVMVAACARDARDLDWMLGVHFAGAFVYGLFALFFFDLDDTGRLGHLLYYDANDLALATVMSLPVVIYFLRDRSPRWQRRMALCVAPVLLINFIRAGSRGGFLGLLAIAVCIVFAYRPVKMRRRIAAFVLGLVAIAAIGGSGFWEKMKTMLAPTDDYNMQSETGRWQIWQNGLSIVRQRPFLGVGAQQFAQGEATLSDLGRERVESGERQLPWQVAHNSYLSVAAETGVFGFGLFVSLLLTSIVTALAMTREARASGARELAALSRALAIAFIGYVVSAFFLTAEYKSVLYLNIGFVLAVRKLTLLSRRRAPARQVHVPQEQPRAVRWR